uniref:Importin N-terminal domain-containing protein n=1 Tax=Lactuca sativa TaxID=4236 RepID=A0A9R1VU16_LACSA|nr:hypothetical protein LSAT_V11C400218750 [Lactuca sativa]
MYLENPKPWWLYTHELENKISRLEEENERPRRQKCSPEKFVALEVTQILLNAQAVDGSVRKHAEEKLAHDEKPVDSRKLAGLILKNALDAKEQHRKYELIQRWLSLDVGVKSQIKTYLLQTLTSPVHEARSTASQVIAKLIGSPLSNINQVPVHVKQATLETLRYLCEEVSPDVVEQDHVNKILIAVVQDMNASEASNDVRLAVTRALYNALGFAQSNFTNEMERDYIMRVVCEATCLGLVARTVGNDIVPLVMPSIEEKITKPDWRQREGATYAFGSILEGPSPN